MDKCPTEIHGHIFFFSCRDGGTTGRSLSRVSKYVRAASAPYRWQTLAISGSKQASAFATALDAQSETLPIRDLFLSDRTIHQAVDKWGVRIGATLGEYEDAESARMKADHESAVRWEAAQLRILAYAAPTLQTLTFLSFDYSNHIRWLTNMLSIAYPRLTELSIRSRRIVFWDRYGSVSGNCATCTSSWLKIPNLKRLHLASFQELDATRLFIQTIAPTITHLRMSGIERDDRVAEALHAELARRGVVPAVLEAPADWDEGGEIIARDTDLEAFLPATIQSVIVQPLDLPPDDVCGCCSGYLDTLKLTRILREMARSSDREQFAFVPELARPAYSYEQALWDWLDRVDGGDGCWDPISCG